MESHRTCSPDGKYDLQSHWFPAIWESGTIDVREELHYGYGTLYIYKALKVMLALGFVRSMLVAGVM